MRPGRTRTGLAFVGSLEWHAAGLMAMAVPMHEATALVEAESDSDTLLVRVCADCAARAHMAVAPVAAGQLPGYRDPGDT